MDAGKRIRRIVQSHPLVIFMRGTPDRPMCQGSADAVRALGAVNADFAHIDLQRDPELRAFLPKHSDWSGLPQIFVNGEFLGGAEVINDLLAQGELEDMVLNLGPELRLAAS